MDKGASNKPLDGELIIYVISRVMYSYELFINTFRLMSPDTAAPVVTRRRALAAGATATVGSLSGCIQRVRSIMNRSSPSTASFSILIPPADEDPVSSAIAAELIDNFDQAGIDAETEFLPREELFRNVLLNGDYEMFISRLPPTTDPDSLRGLLYSLYREEPGWQNPYRFANLSLDELLETQHKLAGDDRQDIIHDAVETFCREQPFTTIGYHSALRAVRHGRFTNWNIFEPHLPLGYYALARTPDFQDAEQEDEVVLTVAVVDTRVTRNFNPLAVEFRGHHGFINLVYESLGYFNDGEFLPWLAKDVTWNEQGDETVAEVTLPAGHQWHDGEPLTSHDVAFTYEFLADTTHGERDQSVPAPAFRVRASLIDNVTVVNDSSVTISFGETSRDVALRAFTVPVFPEHIWSEQTDPADIAGFGGDDSVTEALVWENEEPVGSGPLQVEEIDSNDGIEMVPFEEHFLFSDGVDITDISPSLAFDTLEIETYPSYNVVAEAIKSGEADATAPVFPPDFISAIEDAEDDITVYDRTPGYLYHVGFNTAIEPFSSPNFRHVVGSLIDKTHLIESVFDGYGYAVSNPFDGTEWTPSAYEFDGQDPAIPFVGSNGEVDIDAAQSLFRDRGFEFDEDGNLILQ